MPGSPTLLIDGVDPFAEPGQPPGMSSRRIRPGARAALDLGQPAFRPAS